MSTRRASRLQRQVLIVLGTALLAALIAGLAAFA